MQKQINQRMLAKKWTSILESTEDLVDSVKAKLTDPNVPQITYDSSDASFDNMFDDSFDDMLTDNSAISTEPPQPDNSFDDIIESDELGFDL